MRRPLIRSQRTSLIVGLLLFALGAFFLYQTYEGRGQDSPRILRVFSFW